VIAHRFQLPDRTHALITRYEEGRLGISGIDIKGPYVLPCLEIILAMVERPRNARVQRLRTPRCWTVLGTGRRSSRSYYIEGDSTFRQHADIPYWEPLNPGAVHLKTIRWSDYAGGGWQAADFEGRDLWILLKEICLLLQDDVTDSGAATERQVIDASIPGTLLLRGHLDPAAALEGVRGEVLALDHLFVDPALGTADVDLLATPGKGRDPVTRVRWRDAV